MPGPFRSPLWHALLALIGLAGSLAAIGQAAASGSALSGCGVVTAEALADLIDHTSAWPYPQEKAAATSFVKDIGAGSLVVLGPAADHIVVPKPKIGTRVPPRAIGWLRGVVDRNQKNAGLLVRPCRSAQQLVWLAEAIARPNNVAPKDVLAAPAGRYVIPVADRVLAPSAPSIDLSPLGVPKVRLGLEWNARENRWQGTATFDEWIRVLGTTRLHRSDERPTYRWVARNEDCRDTVAMTLDRTSGAFVRDRHHVCSFDLGDATKLNGCNLNETLRLLRDIEVHRSDCSSTELTLRVEGFADGWLGECMLRRDDCIKRRNEKNAHLAHQRALLIREELMKQFRGRPIRVDVVNDGVNGWHQALPDRVCEAFNVDQRRCRIVKVEIGASPERAARGRLIPPRTPQSP